MHKKKKIINNFERSSIDYFNDINKFSPLSKDEEISLWERYKKNNDTAARDKIIKSNLKFVASVAKPYIGMGLSYSDLIAEGNLGLMKAMEKFKYEKGYKTISYSVWWIRQTILEALKKRNLLKGDELSNTDIQENENETDDEEIVEPENYVDQFNFDNLNVMDDSKVVKNLMDVLTEREKEVISSYFGLNSTDEMTLEEIGENFGLTKERIRQIKECALKKLRTEALKNSITSEILK